MRKYLFKFYRLVQRRIVPNLRFSQHHYCDTLNTLLGDRCTWLDLGCGHQLFPPWMLKQERHLAARSQRFVGIDLDVPSIKKHLTLQDRVVGPIERLPFRSQCFDVVTANMVVEHIENPALVLGEIRRVLRPAGLFIFHTPNLRNPKIRAASRAPHWLKKNLIYLFEGREDADVYETFYQLNTDAAVRHHAESNGFRVEELRLVSTAATTVILGPLVIFELLWLRMLSGDKFKRYRSNIIAVLRKESETQG